MKKSILLATLIATLPLSSLAADNAAPNSRIPVQAATPERADASIKEMDSLFTGPMSKRISSSKSEEVATSMKAAEELRQQAKQAFEKKDYATTIQTANNATKNFLDTIRKTTPEKSPAEKMEQEYKQRLSSANTFIEALDQAVKDSGKSNDATVQNIKKMLTNAKDLAAQKKFGEARDVMDKALISIKVTITAMMQGSVMTAEKDTTPKGVYEYEVFRNETYKALIELLRDEKKLAITSDPSFVSYVKAGDKLHAEAAGIAKGGKYEEATQKMFESTSEFKQAVSLSGITIPD